jgi:outer membrane protein
MKRYLIIVLVIITGILTAKDYTLDDLIEAGLNNSFAMRQKSIMLRNAGLSYQNAAWDLLPSVDVNYGRTNRDETYTSSASAVASKTLTLNEPTYFSFRQAHFDKSIAKLDWQQAKKEMVFSIFTTWLDLAQLQKEVTIQQENLAILRRIKQQSELQMQLGQRTSYDVNQTEINVINAELAIADLNNQMTKLRADLFNKVKLEDDGSPLAFAEAVPNKSPDYEQSNDEPFLLTQFKYETRKSWYSKLQQKIGLFPSVTFSASYGEYSPSLGVRWSLWDPFTKANNYARVSNSYKLTQWQYDEEKSALRLDKDNLKREWTFLSETLALNNRKASQAADNLRIAQERYNLGSLSLIELEQARVASLEAELAVNKLTFQLQKKIQEWNLLNSLLILDKY